MVFRVGNSRTLRKASHAGDWYTDNGQQLDAELSAWLKDVEPANGLFPVEGCKAIIAPHAGYTYSGRTAAWAYKSINTTGIKRVFILGPSHHLYLEGCALSTCKEYDTPIGKLPLDLDTIDELRSTGKFDLLTLNDDEAEHSVEMHLPYVRKIFAGQDIMIVPIVVGTLSQRLEATFGSLLAPYLARDDTFCVVSSDFCHWGSRFSYTYYYLEPAPSDSPAISLTRASEPTPSHPIHASIRRLDQEAMALLTLPPPSAADSHDAFGKYLAKTKNTICGRHPIGVLLGALTSLEQDKDLHPVMTWVRYEQSSACLTVRDSSVSYASAWVKF